jgi:hypothetical protein
MFLIAKAHKIYTVKHVTRLNEIKFLLDFDFHSGHFQHQLFTISMNVI